jgi:ATP-dependent DNA ligase
MRLSSEEADGGNSRCGSRERQANDLLEVSVETNDATACLPNGLNPRKLRCCVTKWTDLKKKMPKSPYAPCIPTRGTKVPSHPDWIHEVKQDGYRLIVSRDGDRVRLSQWL